jgi:cold shock CspA family protein/ribosome-associated translation inhibitor RaiA
METPVEIDFRGIEVSPVIRGKLEAHVAELETRFGRITACRVVIAGPGQRHRVGGPYGVSVHLTLPNGRSVDVDRINHDDERFSDIDFAINDTFKRARRRLQDQARRMQGQVKRHEPLPAGRILSIDPSGDFGFIATADGREIYFHMNSVLTGTRGRLKPGVAVAFAEEEGEKGPQASTVKLAGKHSLR